MIKSSEKPFGLKRIESRKMPSDFKRNITSSHSFTNFMSNDVFLFCSTFGQISSRYIRITEYGPIVINIEKLNGNTLLLTWSYFHKLFTLTAISASESAIVAMLMNYVWGAYVLYYKNQPTFLLTVFDKSISNTHLM